MPDPTLFLDQRKVSRITGIPRTTMNDWERKGVFRPSFHQQRSSGPFSKWYSFRDVVSLKALARIRREGGVDLGEIKRAGEYFSRWSEHPWSSMRVGHIGRKLVFKNPNTGKWEGLSGQQAIQEIVLAHIPDEVEKELPTLLRRPDENKGKIVRSRNVNGNQPTFAGTRVLVSSVRNLIDRGYDDDRILYEYPSLSPSDIEALRKQEQKAAS